MKPVKLDRHGWIIAGAAGLALLILLPFALAGGLGRFVGSLWVTVMGAVMSIIGALFGV